MWPFKRDPAPEPSEYIFCHSPLHSFREVGDTFNYLGRECIVTSLGGLYPELFADYCDNDGVIRQVRFLPNALPGLIKQNGGK